MSSVFDPDAELELERDPGAAFDSVFSAGSGRLVDSEGRFEHLAVRQWAGDSDEADRRLFTGRCGGPTLDIGCGPGRLVGDLMERKVFALGIDVSSVAVRKARTRGVTALRLDVFDEVPGAGSWEHALLADGNIGIGGDPVRLLARVRELLSARGSILVEVSPWGMGVVRNRRRLCVDGQYSEPFDWADVGLDAIDHVAHQAGLLVADVRSLDGRHVATLVPRL